MVRGNVVFSDLACICVEEAGMSVPSFSVGYISGGKGPPAIPAEDLESSAVKFPLLP